METNGCNDSKLKHVSFQNAIAMVSQSQLDSVQQELIAEREERRAEKVETYRLYTTLAQEVAEMEEKLRAEMDQKDERILSMTGQVTLAAQVRSRNILFQFECLDIATQGMSHL